MSNKRILKAYERYDYNGRVVAGSLLLRDRIPKNGKWRELTGYQCCNPTNLGCNSFWINQIINPESADNLYAIGSGMDSNNNTFVVSENYWKNPNDPNTISDESSLLQKFSCNGSLLWEKGFDFLENDNVEFLFIESSTLLIDKEDNIIIPLISGVNDPFYRRENGLLKLDNDGNQLWSISLPLDNSLYADINGELLTDVKCDNLNNIYIISNSLTIDGTVCFASISKISPSGVLLAKKYIEPSLIGFVNFYTYNININSNNEIYIWFNRNNLDDDGGSFYIVKLDQNLNEIWAKTFSGASNISAYGLLLDDQENIVVHFGNSISTNGGTNPSTGAYIKISPDGSVLGTVRLSNVTNPDLYLGTFQMDSDSQGNVYISSIFPSSIPGYTPPSDGFAVIAKISSGGTFEWAYAINATSPNGIFGYYWFCSIAGKVVNNSLSLAYYGNSDQFNGQLFKLPLTLIPNGTYGDYTFTDITNLWTQSSPTVTLVDASLIYNNGSTTYEPLTYLEFAQTSTITNTPL